MDRMFSVAALSNVKMGSLSTDWEVEAQTQRDIVSGGGIFADLSHQIKNIKSLIDDVAISSSGSSALMVCACRGDHWVDSKQIFSLQDHFSWRSIDSSDIAVFSDDPLPDFIITPRLILDTRVEAVDEDEINFLDDLGEGIEFLEETTADLPSAADSQPQDKGAVIIPSNQEPLKSNPPKPKFECKECGKFLSSRTSFQTHKQSHLGATNKCKICDKNFSRSDVLRNHQLTHSSERKFRCDSCEKTFYRAADLRSHQRIHDDAKPYSCPECAKAFKRLGDLRSHNLTHERKGDFSCTQCEKKFLSMGGLKYHHKVHSGEKPFACPQCEQKFRQSANLTKHIRKAHP